VELFRDLISGTSVAAGLISVIGSLISLLLSNYKKRSALTAVEEQPLERVLRSSEIVPLGRYLDTTLSKVTVSQYTSSETISAQVDQYIERIRDFVGTTEEVQAQQIAKQQPEPVPLWTLEIPSELQPVLDELKDGESWNALARLRRLIELHLRDVAKTRRLRIEKVRSAGQLVDLLEKDRYLDSDSANDLRYAIQISNRAVHGLDVTREEAEGAIAHAVRALSKNTGPFSR
jgi:hypothetical protein